VYLHTFVLGQWPERRSLGGMDLPACQAGGLAGRSHIAAEAQLGPNPALLLELGMQSQRTAKNA
jgi:hypothetical protein